MSDPVRIVVGSGESAEIRVASSGVGAEVRVPESGLIVGPPGPAGEDGATFFPEVSEEGIISWTNDGGYNNPEPVNIKGPAGNDGSDGEDGADGVSPAVSFTTITGGHTMTVTDKDHPSGQSINIMDGEDGSTGADGTTFTPSVDDSGNLSWTNDGGKQNPQTVNIKGSQGDAGQGVPAGGTTGQFLKKSSGTSYDTEWGTVEVPTKVSDLTNDTGFITGMEILSYGSSTWSDFLAAYNAKKVVYCRASSNSNPASGSQTRLAFMAYVTNATNPTFVEFQYYRSVSSHTDAQQGDQVFVYKLDKTAGWSVTVREASSQIVAGTNMTSSYANGTLTLNATGGGGTTLTAGDGLDITNDVIKNTQGIEYIVGTQTAATAAWTGVSTDETLKVGKIIAYYLPYAGTSTAATLTLTMADGSTTEAIPLRRQATGTVTTQFAAGNVIILIYDGDYWRVSAYYDTTTNHVPTGYCTTSAGTAAKVATCSYGYRGDTNYFPCVFRYANTAANATLAITTYATTALPIYVNGARTSSTNTFGPGVILFLFYNDAYYCYNDGRLPILVNGAVTSVQDCYRPAFLQDLIDARLQVGIDRSVKEKEIGIAIISKRPDMAVTAGQYVIITSFSGISGVSDGLYIANTALSPSTDVTAADLTAVNDGGLNSLGTRIKNLVLESTGDSTDRTAEIVSRLTTYKKCVLGNGTFYTTGIDMPDGSTLIGMGDATVLHKTGSGNYVINMNKNNGVESLCIDGNDTVSSTIGTHHGILWNGDYSTSRDATLQPQNGKLSNLTIKNCNGGGITCNDTGTKRFNNIVACNVAIMNCNTGINIPYYSEYHRFTNFDVFECYYGCINNGGNNCFANCDFSDSKTIGFVIDNSNGDKTNNSHGTCVGCSFNHIANNSGLALSLTGVTAGFTFGNCNIFRGSVEIINSIGVAITDSLFGESLTITVTNSQAIQFANDTFQGAPTLAISGSSYPHFRDCFNYTTGASILGSELTTRTVTITYSASANDTYNANLKTIIDNDLPSGYKCVGITGVQSGSNACMVYAYRYVNSSYALGIRNVTATAVSSVTATIEYLCKPI